MDKTALKVWYGCVVLYCVFVIIAIIHSIKQRKENHAINTIIKKRVETLEITTIKPRFSFKKRKILKENDTDKS